MLYRNKKKNDINRNKYIGLGGKFEPGETPEECLVREVYEEAGVTLTSYRFRGVITFISTKGASDMFCIFVFTADQYTGEFKDCDEGELCWVDTERIEELDLWEGDHQLWKWLNADKGFFSGKFVYDGEDLIDHSVKFY
jgi:8-oxo-dGTP diphosphatase